MCCLVDRRTHAGYKERVMRHPSLPTRDPHAHATNVERMLRDVREHLDEDLEKIDDAAARILFDTAREVLDGLITSFEDYQRTSGMWRDGIDTTIGGKEEMSVK